MKKYYALEQSERQADIQIYGDITSWPWLKSDVSAYLLSKQIEGLDVDTINVHISSYGGEVSEGWAIYNALRSHKAKIHTFADGFACSIASVIFMAGEKRTMSKVSALMIHEVSGSAWGNAKDLQKEAETLELMTGLSAKAYQEHVTISEEKLKEMMAVETWITPESALEMGFATDIENQQESGAYSQSARKLVFDRVTAQPPAPEEKAIPAADEIAEAIEKRLEAALAKRDTPKKEPEPEPDKGNQRFDLTKFLNAL